ncbi:MAG: HK97 family phage prohead protease [Pseudonocardiaceae bacterium]
MTTTERKRGYSRAYVERDSIAAGKPLRFVAATEGVKGDGIELRMDGAKLDRFRANPVVGYGHCYYSRGDLPIGRATETTVDGDRLLMDVVFDMADEFAARVDQKYRDGFLNAVSIGFNVDAWEDPKSNYYTGGVASQWELFELSAVPLPMDANATVESGRGLDPDFLAQWTGLDPDFLAQWLEKATGREVSPERVAAAVQRHPLSLYRALALAQG